MGRFDPAASPLHSAVLHYVAEGLHILPLWWIENGKCACGDPACPPKSAGKHPIVALVPRAVKSATSDLATAKMWWTKFPKANIGIALGRVSSLVAIDVDGPQAQELLDKVFTSYDTPFVPTWRVETGREDGGYHLYYQYPDGIIVPNHKMQGLEVRSDNTYVVAPPSAHRTGRVYTWSQMVGAPAELPECMIDYANKKLFRKRPILISDGKGKRRSVSENINPQVPPLYTLAEANRISAALQCIPADDYETWLHMGMAVHWTGWGYPAFGIWTEWSKKSDKFDQDAQNKKWDSFDRSEHAGEKITLGSLFKLAIEHGYAPPEETVQEPEEAPQLKGIIDEMNQKHFLLSNIGGKCMVGQFLPHPTGSGMTLSLQSTDAFKTRYGNQYVSILDPEGNARKRPLGDYWLKHKHRRQYEGVELLPNEPAELPNGNLNLWRGYGVEPKAGTWSLLLRHVQEVLANGDHASGAYILRWIAWSLQHPGERAEVAMVFQGGKGCGKGVLCRAIARCFGEHALHISNQEHLVGRFNGHLRSCLYLFVDEAFWAGDKRGEGVLKALITEPVIMLEQKGIDPVQWPNRVHVVMAANAEWVVPASAGERRYAVFKCADTYVRGQAAEGDTGAYFEALHRELDNGGLEAMMHDLLQFDLGDWHPRQVPETKGLHLQKEQSLPPIEQWFVELLEEAKLPGNDNMFAKEKNLAATSALMEDAVRRSPRLRNLLSDRALATFLTSWGCFRTNHVRTGAGERRGWKFPPLDMMRADWAKRYGQWEWRDPAQSTWE